MKNNNGDLLSRIIFRAVQPVDIPRCHQIESASYPEDEAASKSALQYRQHHAAPFFRCAFLVGDGGNPGGGTTSASSSISYQGRSMNPAATLCGTIIGFVCSTRCKSFTAEAMKTHDASGGILAIHSVVVEERFRNCGVASAMLQDYVTAMERLNKKGVLKVKMEKIVLMAKKNMLAFYVRGGFMALGVSKVVHGKEQWFQLERSVDSSENSKEKTHKCYIVDSFADVDKPGSGNPAAIVLLDGPPGVGESNNGKGNESDSDDSLDEMDGESDHKKVQDCGVLWMATVAKEFNLSETAFVWPIPNGATLGSGTLGPVQSNDPSPTYAIRYYTKSGAEVDLCGHATLAAASVLLLPQKFEDPKQNPKVSFLAKNDDLQAELIIPPPNAQPTPVSTSSKASRISMNFPWKSVTPVSPGKDGQEAVLNMLSCSFSGADDIGKGPLFHKFRNDRSSFFTQHVVHMGTTDGREDLLIELSEEGFDLLRGMNVNYGALSAWQGYHRGVIICCASAPKTESAQPTAPSIDFRSRFFGPRVGIDEDPVTGSAHCSLGPYFGKQLGKTLVVGRQESDRGGVVECILKQEEGRVCIVGTAVTTLAGQLSINMI